MLALPVLTRDQAACTLAAVSRPARSFALLIVWFVAGALSFPFDLCRERFEVQGLLARVLAGDPSYAEP